MSNKWKKLPAMQSTILGCLCCGHTPALLPLETVLYQEFGGWTITRNGKIYYCAEQDEKAKTLADIEKIAAKDSNNDWRADVLLPLREASYQRQDDKKWVLVRTGLGFA